MYLFIYLIFSYATTKPTVLVYEATQIFYHQR